MSKLLITLYNYIITAMFDKQGLSKRNAKYRSSFSDLHCIRKWNKNTYIIEITLREKPTAFPGPCVAKMPLSFSTLALNGIRA